jgi:hypothetical protein
MSTVALGLALTGLLHLTTEAHPNTALSDAEGQVSNLSFSQASKSLSKARNESGNDRPTLLRILELSGVVYASLGKSEKALDAFKQLIFLDPGHTLSGEWGPKVSTPYLEAKGWAGDQHRLVFSGLVPQSSPGHVKTLTIELGEDPLHLFRSMKMHLGSDTQTRPATPGTKFTFDVPGTPAEVHWWAELIGPHDEVLGNLGDEQTPMIARAPAVEVVEQPKPPADVPVHTTVASATLTNPNANVTPNSNPNSNSNSAITTVKRNPPTEDEPQMRPLAYGLAAGGLVALGVGGFLGLQVHNAQSQLTNAQRDSEGRILPTSLTQKQAYQLDQQVKTEGPIADVLFVAGGVAAAAGVGVFIWGTIYAEPAPTGVAVSGKF